MRSGKCRISFTPTTDSDRSELQNLAAQIAASSGGVFLWARYGLFELNDGKILAQKDAALRRRLKKIPQELQDISARIIQRRTNAKKEFTDTTILLICIADRTMTVTELYEATFFT